MCSLFFATCHGRRCSLKWFETSRQRRVSTITLRTTRRTREKDVKMENQFSSELYYIYHWLATQVALRRISRTCFVRHRVTMCIGRTHYYIFWNRRKLHTLTRIWVCSQQSAQPGNDADVRRQRHDSHRSSDQFEHSFFPFSSSPSSSSLLSTSHSDSFFVRLLFCVWLVFVHVLDCMHFECASNYVDALCYSWLMLLMVAARVYQQFNVRRQHEIIRCSIRFWFAIQFFRFFPSSSSHLILLVESRLFVPLTAIRFQRCCAQSLSVWISLKQSAQFVSSITISCCCRRHCFPVSFLPKRCSARCFFISVGMSLGSTLHLHPILSSLFQHVFLRVAQLQVYFLASFGFLVFSIIYDVIVVVTFCACKLVFLLFSQCSLLLAVARCTCGWFCKIDFSFFFRSFACNRDELICHVLIINCDHMCDSMLNWFFIHFVLFAAKNKSFSVAQFIWITDQITQLIHPFQTIKIRIFDFCFHRSCSPKHRKEVVVTPSVVKKLRKLLKRELDTWHSRCQT